MYMYISIYTYIQIYRYIDIYNIYTSSQHETIIKTLFYMRN